MYVGGGVESEKGGAQESRIASRPATIWTSHTVRHCACGHLSNQWLPRSARLLVRARVNQPAAFEQEPYFSFFIPLVGKHV